MLRTTRKGFTLIELLIVVVIIGILAAVAIPKFANTKDKARVAAMKTDLRNFTSAMEGHFADYNVYPTTIAATGASTATTIVFQPTTGNVLAAPTAVAGGGWSVSVTNATVAGKTCAVSVGGSAVWPRTVGGVSLANDGEVKCT